MSDRHDAPEEAVPPPPDGPDAGRRPRIIVCDDARSIRALIAALLGARYDCLLLESGEEVVKQAAAFAPDLIISDVVMPGMNGHELCRRVREDPALRAIPFMLLTAVTNLESRAQALEVGADDYLFKPICERELLARVTSLVRLRQAMVQLEERSHALERANRDLRETQGALLRMENLAAVGTLAAGVAHEINGPLSVVKSGLAAIRNLVADLEGASAGEARTEDGGRPAVEAITTELRAVLADMDLGGDRLARIARDLKSAALNRNDDLVALELAAEVDHAWDLAVVRTRSRARLVRRYDACGAILSSRQLIGQALVNILVNAVQACGDDGTVEVSLRDDERGVELAVRDDGPGIPAEHLPRVFDPFFTTRPAGQGLGLGLSTSQAIVGSLGGQLHAESRPGAGATFRMLLPHRAITLRLP